MIIIVLTITGSRNRSGKYSLQPQQKEKKHAVVRSKYWNYKVQPGKQGLFSNILLN